jgi:hypothetical protein
LQQLTQQRRLVPRAEERLIPENLGMPAFQLF